jgi:hypothetical protein
VEDWSRRVMGGKAVLLPKVSFKKLVGNRIGNRVSWISWISWRVWWVIVSKV